MGAQILQKKDYLSFPPIYFVLRQLLSRLKKKNQMKLTHLFLALAISLTSIARTNTGANPNEVLNNVPPAAIVNTAGIWVAPDRPVVPPDEAVGDAASGQRESRVRRTRRT